jgi:CheY-like chemotaxis protein
MNDDNRGWDEVSLKLRTSNRQILVVDDDPDLCDFVRESLENAHYEVRVAKDGAAALAALAREIPDVLLLDIRMPRITGDEVLDLLASIKHHPPIVVMTAASSARDLALAHRNPFYLPKPFDEALLLATVETALEALEQPEISENNH